MTAAPHSHETDGDLVTVARFADPMRAQLAKGLLHSAGIDCFLQGANANRMLSSAFRSRLRVLRADEADARELLEGTGDLEPGDDRALASGGAPGRLLPGRAGASTLFAAMGSAPDGRADPDRNPASEDRPLPSVTRPRTVLCLSGGMDSAVCAALAARDADTYALHCSYGQRTEARELQAAQEVAAAVGVRDFLHLRLDLFRRIGGSALTDPSIPIPDAPTDESAIGAAIPVTYVPFRNAHFLAAAVSWAEVLGATRVFLGAVEQDSSGYPDCRPSYYDAFNQLIREGTREGTIRVETPLIRLRKSDIVRLGLELGAPLHVSWSCYTGKTEACGTCESCVLRLRAFREAGVDDPIPYARKTP